VVSRAKSEILGVKLHIGMVAGKGFSCVRADSRNNDGNG
jgi:hypothetical protein